MTQIAEGVGPLQPDAFPPRDLALFEAGENLPQDVVPMIQYLDEHPHDVILACDRNARPIGAALTRAYDLLEQPIPGGEIHYRKVTSKGSAEILRLHLQPFFDGIKTNSDEPVRIAVIDDHIRRGDTKRAFVRAAQAAEGVAAHVSWLTFTGKGSDLSLFPHISPFVKILWRDRPEALGIDYDDSLRLHEQPTLVSRAFYAAISRGQISSL